MKLVADLHIHSHFSRATSKDLTFEHLALWAQLKGVHVVGTGDIAHPGWLQEMRAKLEPAEEGLFRLKADYATAVQEAVPPACRAPVRFLLAGEISNIYKRHGAVRKVHNVVFAPTLEVVEHLQLALEKIGNIRADGRPILGLDSRDLLEIVLNADPRCHLIPAHIWTPWFSMLGSKSGFDSVEECFGDLTPYIFALETGLSSDPPMNWRVSHLDRYTLVSNSDAHSPQKLAREATIYHSELTYDALFQALQTGDPSTFGGTIEFFPEEGKYHLDGHRKCGVCWQPETTQAHQGICPRCGKPVTVGTMHRIAELSDRLAGQKPSQSHPFYSLIPLAEILAELHGVGAGSKRVDHEYTKLLGRFGPELAILQDLPIEEIASGGGSRLAEGIRRMRRGEVSADAGYDGEYGVIRLFALAPSEASIPQIDLFGDMPASAINLHQAPESYAAAGAASETFEMGNDTTGATTGVAAVALVKGVPWTQTPFFDSPASADSALTAAPPAIGVPSDEKWLAPLNPEQRAAVLHTGTSLLIVAGPGTGKTRTLTVRIAHLIRSHHIAPEAMLAITFTNKAAEEMANRLNELLEPGVAEQITLKTFHAFGSLVLRAHGDRLGHPTDFGIVREEEQRALFKRAFPTLREGEVDRRLMQIADAKNQLLGPDAPEVASEPLGDNELPAFYHGYDDALRNAHMLDFDDLVLQTVRLFETQADVLQANQARYRYISVDEYQDVNLAQYRLLRLLAAGGADLCVIGDPDQAIYGFRGADRRYFLAFEQDFPGARQIHLHQSYRSPQSLLDAAAQVISRSPDRKAISLWSDFAEQVKVDTYEALTGKAEAEYVVHQIEQMVGGTSYFSLDSGRTVGAGRGDRSFSDFAVLFRLGAQRQLLVEAFDRSGIPYQAVGQASFFAQKAVRAILAYLWLLFNPQSRLHLEEILVTGRPALPQAVIDRVTALMASERRSPADWFDQAARSGDASTGQRRRLATLSTFWRELEQAHTRETVAELVTRIHTFLDGSDRQVSGAAPGVVDQLRLRAVPYGNRLGLFLEAAALQGETDTYDPRADRVTLMTIHAAKGLEFPVVLIVGCEEGLLPYTPEPSRTGGASDLEEERRLFYVALTRAREKLILTYARRRLLYGRTVQQPPSRFVGDIGTALKEVHEHTLRRGGQSPTEERQLRLL